MNICAARDQGPSSAGMARHLAPFSWRQRMAEMVRRRSFGCVLPLGRHASTNGSKFVHCASDTIALSSFQKEQNARHHKQFKREQALVCFAAVKANRIVVPKISRLCIRRLLALPGIDAASPDNHDQQHTHKDRFHAHQYSFPLVILTAVPVSKYFFSMVCCCSSMACLRPNTWPNMTVCCAMRARSFIIWSA